MVHNILRSKELKILYAYTFTHVHPFTHVQPFYAIFCKRRVKERNKRENMNPQKSHIVPYEMKKRQEGAELTERTYIQPEALYLFIASVIYGKFDLSGLVITQYRLFVQVILGRMLYTHPLGGLFLRTLEFFFHQDYKRCSIPTIINYYRAVRHLF